MPISYHHHLQDCKAILVTNVCFVGWLVCQSDCLSVNKVTEKVVAEILQRTEA